MYYKCQQCGTPLQPNAMRCICGNTFLPVPPFNGLSGTASWPAPQPKRLSVLAVLLIGAALFVTVLVVFVVFLYYTSKNLPTPPQKYVPNYTPAAPVATQYTEPPLVLSVPQPQATPVDVDMVNAIYRAKCDKSALRGSLPSMTRAPALLLERESEIILSEVPNVEPKYQDDCRTLGMQYSEEAQTAIQRGAALEAATNPFLNRKP